MVNRREYLLPSKRIFRPRETIGSDLFELNGMQYLVVVCYFSRWIEAAPLRSTTAATLINHIKSSALDYQRFSFLTMVPNTSCLNLLIL